MDILEVTMAVVAAVILIAAPLLTVRTYDRCTRHHSARMTPRPARSRALVAADLQRLRRTLSDPMITVGDRRQAAAAYDQVLAEACALEDVEHDLDARFAGHLDRELERFRVEARLQSVGWSLRQPGRLDA